MYATNLFAVSNKKMKKKRPRCLKNYKIKPQNCRKWQNRYLYNINT